jgi:6-phosphogluconate dehydrogenase
MKIGMIGLGRMGANMTTRLLQNGHEVVAYDRSQDAVGAAERGGAGGAASLADLVKQLSPPRAVWVMVPAGDPTNQTIDELAGLLDAGDTIVDGGNSNYKHAVAAAEALKPKGIAFVDAGVSGGIWGLQIGYCLMVGGDRAAVAPLEPIFLALAPENGYAHVGPTGAGHFVKMVHNGIEYGMLQAYAEGFAVLDAAHEFNLDNHQIASLWQNGSVVRSWLLDLAELALANPKEFNNIKGVVADSGEGRWTVEEGVARGVPVPVIAESLFARFSSQNPDLYANRLVAALRNQFGGHAVVSEGGRPASP